MPSGYGLSSRTSVTGPSLTSSTSMCSPNAPPCAPSRARNCSYSGSASSGRAAPTNDGRLPLRASPSSVNWLTTRTSRSPSGSFMRPSASSKIRSAPTLSASRSQVASSSPCATPSKTSRPGPIDPTVSEPARTAARLTRWTTARTAGSHQRREHEGGGDDDRRGPRDRAGREPQVQAVEVGDDERVDAGRHSRLHEVRVGGADGQPAERQEERRGDDEPQDDRRRDRRRERRRELETAVVALVHEVDAEDEEAERQQGERRHLGGVDERLGREHVRGQKPRDDGEQHRVAGQERARALAR